jgi:hypothetical protein
MRNLNELDQYRLKNENVLQWYGSYGDDKNGVFIIDSPDGVELRMVISSGMGWEHISVSTIGRCPQWLEMDYVKRTFFRQNEVAMQLHPAVKDHINVHPYTLHIWRPLRGTIPLPPKFMV